MRLDNNKGKILDEFKSFKTKIYVALLVCIFVIIASYNHYKHYIFAASKTNELRENNEKLAAKKKQIK